MQSLRRHFLLDPSVTFLNHGSFGATPRPVFREYQRWQRLLEFQPVEFLGRRGPGLMAQARAALGAYLHAGADDLVFTQNVTIAVNIVARSLELGPGDEVLATDHEYGACERIWRFLAGERGFHFVTKPITLPLTTADAFVDALWQGVTPRTRLIFLSHVTSPTALILPVAEVCRRARAAGILTLIDGAHGPGQLPLDLAGLGADFYGGNLHKWLCAPKGAGFLYARPEVQDLLKPLVVSWGYEAEKPGPSRFIDHHEWWGTRDLAAFLSVPAAIEFQDRHDWEGVRAACHELARRAQEGVVRLTGLPPLHPDHNWYAQMTTAPLPAETDLDRLKVALYDEYRIEVPLTERNGMKLIRISLQGYNAPGDVRRLIEVLGILLRRRS